MSNGKGCLERCELWGNANGGVRVQEEGDPTLAACIIRDHSAGSAIGVIVRADAAGKATIGSDCVFARNAGGDVVREGSEVEVAAAPAEAAVLPQVGAAPPPLQAPAPDGAPNVA